MFERGRMIAVIALLSLAAVTISCRSTPDLEQQGIVSLAESSARREDHRWEMKISRVPRTVSFHRVIAFAPGLMDL